jgi:hypothetical protein
MATALDLILRARRLLNAHGVGETLDTELANNGLEALNAMLSAWSLDGLLVYALQSNTFTLTNAQTYTVGIGGAFNMTRPDRIESAFATIGGSDYVVGIIENDQWNRLINKNITSNIPSYLKYDIAVPLATLSIMPQTTGTLTINTYKPLQRFNNLTDVMALPNGYERAIVLSLAIEISPEVGRPASDQLMMLAASAKAALMRIHADNAILTIDSSLLGGGMVDGWQAGLNG